MNEYSKLQKLRIYLHTVEVILELINEAATEIKIESENGKYNTGSIEAIRKRLTSLARELTQVQPEDSFTSLEIKNKYALHVNALIISRDALEKASKAKKSD